MMCQSEMILVQAATTKEDAPRSAFARTAHLASVLPQMCRRQGILLTLMLAFAGCSSTGAQHSPFVSHVDRVEPWGEVGRVIHTPRYKIFSTLDPDENPELEARIASVLEAANAEYAKLVPQIAPTTQPMECYFFQTRAQWAATTETLLGPELAPAYLRIGFGGYTFGDRFVAYFLTHERMLNLTAHEGWHQFAHRHFVGRLPPSLEEGIACTFEDVRWQQGQPVWDRARNIVRAAALREALADRTLWPLDEFVKMHAGEVIGKNARIEAFYAQCWAWARFLEAGENGKHAEAFRRLLADAAKGTLVDPTGSLGRAGAAWDASGIPKMYAHYLGQNLAALEPAFRRYAQSIAQRPSGTMD